MTDLRTRIAAIIDREVDELWEPLAVADAVIRELPELGRIAKVTEVCIASLDLDSRVGTALSDRQWLAETILNVLNGAVDD